MKLWLAIIFSLLLIIASVAAGHLLKFNLAIPMVLGTSLWAAWDSSKISLHKYKHFIPYRPVPLFVLCCLLWIVVFPAYLSVKEKIANKAIEPVDTTNGTNRPNVLLPSAVPGWVISGLLATGSIGWWLVRRDPSTFFKNPVGYGHNAYLATEIVMVVFLFIAIFFMTRRTAHNKLNKIDLLGIGSFVCGGTLALISGLHAQQLDVLAGVGFLAAWFGSATFFRKGSIILVLGGGFLAAILLLLGAYELGNFAVTKFAIRH